jgi:hypothetical protein
MSELPAQELSAELKVTLPVEHVDKLKRASELAKELVRQQKELAKATKEANDAASGQVGGGGAGTGRNTNRGQSSAVIANPLSASDFVGRMSQASIRPADHRMEALSRSNLAANSATGFGAYRPDSLNRRDGADGWRDSGERTTYGTGEDRGIAKEAIDASAKRSKAMIAARIGGYITFAAKIALDELDARNKADIVLQQGGSGGDASRAALNSNFFTRKAVSAYDTITNREGKLYEVQLASQRAEISRQGRQEQRNLALEYTAGRRHLGAGIAAIDQIPNVVQSPIFNTMTLAGRTQREEFQRRAPIAAQDFDLQRRQRAIEIERGGMVKQYNEFVQENRGQVMNQNRAGLAAGRAGEAQGGMFGLVQTPDEAAKTLKHLDEQIRLGKDVNKTLERQQELARAIVEKDKEGVQVNADRAKLKAEHLRADAAMYNQRADEAEGQSLRIGTMSPMQRNMSLNALKTFMSSSNPDMLSQEIVKMASGIAPKTVQERQMQIGAETPEMQELRRIAPNEFKGDAEELRGKAIEAENKIPEVNLKIDRQKLVQELEVAWNPQIEQAFKELLQANNQQQMIVMANELKRMAMGIKDGNKAN